ncbi:type VI secretion system-associated FHA domain protein TagH [Aquincola sp. S2]|uniref:Type VI secretion system-associated FHA domain protein TagH n=1 Tax=Pseudaquabacterium terrae TaxID=2732868 RepID=A0ABX2EF04_9BURK|nr:type VI secretion system-associated FHA domain protein TagH [Aquabacterium terrae]NRF67176.1 type VI secretion system-associated FHA domain protein TagH [Aquabacterium terrae]
MFALRILRRPDSAPGGVDLIAVGPAGATIGRAQNCEVVLEDPLRLVSRHHAWIAAEAHGQALLRCLSTISPMTVNEERLMPNHERLVRPGDRLRIGGFELAVEWVGMPTLVPHNDPLATTVAAVPNPGPVPYAPPAPPAPPPARLDRWFDLETVPDPLGPESPLPALRDPSLPPGAAGRPGPQQDAVWPPTLLMQRPPPESLAAEAAAAASADYQALRQAFLHGAGLDPATPFTLDAVTLAHLGALLRASTEGTLELLRARALTKRNLRAKGTGVTARENNLLKFAPDVGEALKLLLEPAGRPGFLGPVEAVRAANHDLQVHQLAMAAGMRAAMLDLITQLGPAAIEASADPPQGAARVMPALREAQLWQRLQQAHARLVEHLDDTFDSAFGREFVRAYEAFAAQAGGEPPAEGESARH